MAIVIFYSVHLPLLIVLGLIYFFIRMFSDMFMYLSVFGHEIESGGNMILGSLNWIGFILIFYHLCMFFFLLSDGHYLASILIFLLLSCTFAIHLISRKSLLNSNLLKTSERIYFKMNGKERKDFNENEWLKYYQHPL